MSEKEVLYAKIYMIRDEKIRDYVKKALDKVPDYFWIIPASSSGKYHPVYALGEGGLVRHVLATLVIAEDLMKMDDYDFGTEGRDIILASLMLHDCYKQGINSEGHSIDEHPVVCFSALKNDPDLNNLLPMHQENKITNAVLTHMGQWRKNKSGEDFTRLPYTNIEKFVHLCDYLASRRSINVILQ